MERRERGRKKIRKSGIGEGEMREGGKCRGEKLRQEEEEKMGTKMGEEGGRRREEEIKRKTDEGKKEGGRKKEGM